MSGSESETVHPGLKLGRRHPEAHRRAKTEVFGFWIFMMSDIIVFGLLIATYVTMLGATAGGPGPADLLELRSAFMHTMSLIGSSAAVGDGTLAVKSAPGPGRRCCGCWRRWPSWGSRRATLPA